MSTDKIDWPSYQDIEWDPNTMNARYGPSTSLKNEPRVMVRLDCNSYNGYSIPGGTRAVRGRQFMLVYKREIEKLKKEFPTESERALLEQAKRNFDVLLDGAIEAHGGSSLIEADRIKARDVAALTIGTDVWGQYHRLANPDGKGSRNRAYPPLDNLVIRDGDVPPPETPQGRAEQAHAAQTNAFTAALEKLAVMMAGNQNQKQAKNA